MIWRIFEKDWKLLWPLVLVVTVGQIANASIWNALGPYAEPRGLLIVAQTLSYLVLLGIAAIVACVVQLDSLPGDSQDWLVRPFRRASMLGAKLLFIIVFVHGPMFMVDVTHGLSVGLGVGDVLAASMWRSLCAFVVVVMPVLALASMTGTSVQVAVAVLAIWLLVACGVAAGMFARGGSPPVFAATGMQWMTPAFWCAVAVVFSAVIVPLQYFRRATGRARILAAVAPLLAASISYLPWASAFQVQQEFSPDPLSASSMTLAFDPGIGRAPAEPGSAPTRALFLPLRVEGLPPETIVLTDRAQIRILDAHGATLYSGRSTDRLGYGDDLPIRSIAGGSVMTHQKIILPAKVYALIEGQTVRLEIGYSLTLLRREGQIALPALDGVAGSGLFGACRSSLDPDGQDIRFGCIRAGGALSCFSAFLENGTTGARNADAPYCTPDYAPFRMHLLPDAVSQFGGEVQFHGLPGSRTFPVDGSQLKDARVRLTSYRAAAHVVRLLAAPQIRLTDWATQPQPQR